MDDKMMAAALIYADWGWAIHPLRPGEKRPLLNDWPNKATTDPATIRQWWQKWPDANIGLACGPSGVYVVDLDVKNDADGLQTWADLLANHGIPEPQTPCSQTPSGRRHILFRANGAALSNTAGKLGPGIDTRGNGGYIVLPPSKLIRKPWEWLPDARPEALPLAELPQPIIQMLQDPPQATPAPTNGGGGAYARAALEGELGKVIMAIEGTRNATLNSAAFSLGQLVGAGALDRSEVESRLAAVAGAIGLNGRETQATIKSGLDAGEQKPRVIPERDRASSQTPPPEPPTGGPILDTFSLSDMGNSDRLKAWHGDDLRYCDPWGQWLVWDRRRWQQDDVRSVELRGREAVDTMFRAAADEPDEHRRAALANWAGKSQSGHRRREMINGARALLPILPHDLDRDPWLLTVNNGTIDLRTGDLLPHRRADYITKLVPVDYDPQARAPIWERFLDRIMQGNQDLIRFLQRAAGYSLTGNTQEQCFFILYGSGANGKSTFLEALSDLLADYSCKTEVQTLLTKRRDDSASPNIARLKGARLVTASENEDGRRFAEALLKQLTGGDTISARFLYGKPFDFKPQFKLWLATNHKPQVRGNDHAIWRRIHLIPFTVAIPPEEQDKDLGAKLTAELPGILAWAVRGCLEWQRQGLGVPKEVKKATASYRAEQDRLADWLEDCCYLDNTAQGRGGDLYQSYKGWCEANGERDLGARWLGQRLGERGLDKYRDKKGIYYMGIGLQDTNRCPPGLV